MRKVIGISNLRIRTSNYLILKKLSEDPPICECGCGKKIPIKPEHLYFRPRFIKGHHAALLWRGKKRPEHSKALTGKHYKTK